MRPESAIFFNSPRNPPLFFGKHSVEATSGGNLLYLFASRTSHD